jgi:hypothetical protein
MNSDYCHSDASDQSRGSSRGQTRCCSHHYEAATGGEGQMRKNSGGPAGRRTIKAEAFVRIITIIL